ncbi:MAG TPA: shikimate kinase [Lachnospiraceae bacterium]|nr:shikimate kinase [Lachnospiraceae bacterium]
MNNIILIGFMGSGKSTVGLRLSYKLELTMIDVDKQIEKEQNATISQIFTNYGEEYFRDLESSYLEKIRNNQTRQIISVGGGLPLRKENRALLKEMGQVIYLKASPFTIYSRLEHDTQRPLLQGEQPLEKISSMMLKREPIYEEAATRIIETDGKTFDEIINEIVVGIY